MFELMLTNLTGALVFLFVFWKRLKEDYIAQQIFTTAFYILVGIAVATLLVARLFPEWWFWLTIMFVGVGLTVGIKRFELRFYETLEAVAIALLPWLGLVFLRHAVVGRSLASLGAVLVVAALIALFLYLSDHYKKFTWYKSGRIGFAGLTTLGVFFLIRTAVAPFAGSVLSFAHSFDVFASGILSLGIFLLLLRLSRAT